MNRRERRYRNKITPIKSRQEADETRSKLVNMTMQVTGSDETTALERMDKLFKSKELDGLIPTDQKFYRIVDDYMTGRK